MSGRLLALALLLAGCAGAEPAAAPPAAPAAPTAPLAPPDVLAPRNWLLLSAIDGAGRRPVRPDAVFAYHLLAPDAPPPAADEHLVGETGTARWVPTTAGDDGAPDLSPLGEDRLGWAWTSVELQAPRVLLLEARGITQVFVNGAPVWGDVYMQGSPPLPVALRAGRNELAAVGFRGQPSLRLLAPPRALFVAGDVTCPDVAVGQRLPPGSSAAVLVVNASLQAAPLALESGGLLPDGTPTVFERLAPPTGLVLPPLSVLKVPVPVMWHAEAAPPAAPGEVRLPLRLHGLPGEPPQELSVPLIVRAEGGALRHTYVSEVDRSVQEFTLVPPSGGADSVEQPGLVLTLHGAGADAWSQATSYGPKPDFWICAPTNRRPFGFDWQDWGRRDAYDVLSEALVISGADGARVMLTGHSMGGHGTWHLGANDPDRFAALAPSAGWRSFDSYGSRPAGALGPLWRGADAASDTVALVGNLAPQPTFILHGTADDNVPASEGRAMEEALRAAGGAPQSHWEEGAPHWWDGDASPGVDCVDWPGFFELFRGARRPSEPDVIDVTIADPWQDARHHWFVALQPQRYGEPLHVSGVRRTADDEVDLVTHNVRRCAVLWKDGRAPARLIVDGQPIEREAFARGARYGLLLREGETWTPQPGSGVPPGEKSPERSGPFKRAFDRGFLLVYGTGGDAVENQALLDRARGDAGEWWYRGNGHAPLLSDREFLRLDALPEFAGRNVILYGNADTNAAWSAVLPADCPLAARRGELRLGERTWQGVDLGAAFVFPRAGQPAALVGAFADSGVQGTRLLDTLTPFRSGVGYPDFVLLGPRVLREGDAGVLAAGWFGPDWKLDASQAGTGF